MNLGPTEIILILVIILVLFGGRKLPELAKGLGQGMREFKNATREEPKAEKEEDEPGKPKA